MKWTLEMCCKDAKKYKTKGEWRKKSPKAYRAAQRKKWLSECYEYIKTALID